MKIALHAIPVHTSISTATDTISDVVVLSH